MLFFLRVIEMNEDEDKDNTSENPYLLLGFWTFAIISTLVVLFFPFSLLFCVLFYGLEQTKLLIIALLHDAMKTFLAVLSVVLAIVALVSVVIFIGWEGEKKDIEKAIREFAQEERKKDKLSNKKKIFDCNSLYSNKYI